MNVSLGDIQATLKLKDEISAQLQRARPQLEQAGKAMAQLETSTGGVDKALGKMKPQVDAVTTAIGKSTEAAAAHKKIVDDQRKALHDASGAASQFDEFLKRTGLATDGATDKGKRFDGMLTKLAGGLTGLVVGGLVTAGKQAVTFAGQLADLSAATGLSTTFLQKLEHASGQVDVQLSEVARAVQFAQREVVNGAPATESALRRINMTLSEARSLSPDDLFRRMAAGIADVKNPAEKTALAMELFGQSGAQLLPLLNDYEALSAGAITMSERSVNAFDAMGDAVSRWSSNLRNATGEALASMTSIRGWMDILGGRPGAADEWFLWRDAADAIRTTGDALESVQTRARGAVPPLRSAADALKDLPGLVRTAQSSITESDRAAAAFQAWADQVTGRKVMADLAQLEARLAAIGGVQRMTSHEWMAMGKHLVTTRQQGAQLSPVLREIADAYQLLMFSQQGYVQSVQRTRSVLGLSDADVRNAHQTLLDSKVWGIDKLTLPGPMLNFPKPKPGEARNYGGELGATIMSAATGGGNIGQAIGAKIGFDIGEHLAKKAGEQASGFFKSGLGKVVAGALPGLGAVLAPLAGKLVGFFGSLFSGGEGAKANDLRDSLKKDLLAAVKGLENDPQIKAGLDAFNASGNRKGVQAAFDATMAAVERTNEAMRRYGLSLDDLGGKSATLSRDLKRVIDDFGALRRAGFSVSQVTAGAASDLNGLLASALETGAKLPASLQPFLHELVTSGQLTDDLKRKLLGLADPVPWKEMEEAANRYGISLDALGQKFQQAKLDDAAAQLAKDWKLLADNGADINGVMAGMSDEVNELIGRALTLGLTIPESMRPMLESMARAGLLVDENGEKLEDLSRIEFAPDILSDFDLLIEKIDELIDALLDGLYPAIENIPSPNVPGASGSTDQSTAPHGNPQYDADGTPRAHTGAMVTAHGIKKHHRGRARILPFPQIRHDEVPAILQAGEAVLNRQAAARMGEPAIRALNNGATGAAGATTIALTSAINIDGAKVAEVVEYHRVAARERLGA